MCLFGGGVFYLRIGVVVSCPRAGLTFPSSGFLFLIFFKWVKLLKGMKGKKGIEGNGPESKPDLG